jgi:putative transposase
MNEQTFFITANAYMKRNILQSVRMGELLIDVLYSYRTQGKFLLHDFVVMPDHLHAIISPSVPIKKAGQFIKGGFSFRAKKELGYLHNVWQPGFHDHRIRNFDEYCVYKRYVAFNPVKRGLVIAPEEFQYSSSSGKYELDSLPPGLKPLS